MNIKKPLAIKELPEAPALRKLLGPSFILLGLGLGSGEVVLWPYMTSQYGLGILWGIVVGITMQFFINMEVSRYALINGESIFVGFARAISWLPVWFILSTFLGFGWPGIGLFGSSLLAEVVKPVIEVKPSWIAIIVFVSIGIILTAGKVLYQTVEKMQKVLIGVSIPIIFLLTCYIATTVDVVALFKGLLGMGEVAGEAYSFLPKDIVWGTFLGALAYAGAGGNLNLSQSCYVRDKGYGMGIYADKISNLFTTKTSDPISIAGSTFEVTSESLKRFRNWWRVINLEHLLIFWLLGLFTMLMLSLLAYATTKGHDVKLSGVSFIVLEANYIAESAHSIFGLIFLLITGVMLCATQMTVLDSTSRIITENILLLQKENRNWSVSKLYYIVLWSQIVFGITVFSIGFNQPLSLIILGAVINAFSMFVYTGIILWLNNRTLAQELRPSWLRNLGLTITFLFFGFFCAATLYFELSKI